MIIWWIILGVGAVLWAAGMWWLRLWLVGQFHVERKRGSDL